jgi:hypothetical protein
MRFLTFMLTRGVVLVRVLALVLVVAATAPAGAQSTTSPTLYRVEAGSSFSRGCYGPCLCPIFTTEDIRGTYTLAFDHVDSLFTWYRVEKVNWVVALGGVDTRVTGSGMYRVGGEVAVQRQMKLTLTIGDERAQTFDSGLVSGEGSFPEIDIVLSMNGMMSCFDTVIDIRSKPVSAPYTLSASTYVEGCFAPCQCPIRKWPVGGSFDLVPLPNAATPIRKEFAVVDVVWATISTSSPPDQQFTGFGTYQIVREGSTGRHRMVLDLTEASSGATYRFDSGVVAGGREFPRIDIDIAVDGFSCFDRAFSLHAAPSQ